MHADAGKSHPQPLRPQKNSTEFRSTPRLQSGTSPTSEDDSRSITSSRQASRGAPPDVASDRRTPEPELQEADEEADPAAEH